MPDGIKKNAMQCNRQVLNECHKTKPAIAVSMVNHCKVRVKLKSLDLKQNLIQNGFPKGGNLTFVVGVKVGSLTHHGRGSSIYHTSHQRFYTVL